MKIPDYANRVVHFRLTRDGLVVPRKDVPPLERFLANETRFSKDGSVVHVCFDQAKWTESRPRFVEINDEI